MEQENFFIIKEQLLDADSSKADERERRTTTERILKKNEVPDYQEPHSVICL